MTVCNAVRGKFIIASLPCACGDSSTRGGERSTGGEQLECLWEAAREERGCIFPDGPGSPCPALTSKPPLPPAHYSPSFLPPPGTTQKRQKKDGVLSFCGECRSSPMCMAEGSPFQKQRSRPNDRSGPHQAQSNKRLALPFCKTAGETEAGPKQ